MIDDYNADRTGWARFSDDRVMRYRFARSLTGRPICVDRDEIFEADDSKLLDPWDIPRPKRVTFLMLNPSTADAFELDATIKRCRRRAIAMGADVLEVVNLFAFRSQYPEDLRRRSRGERGDDEDNNTQILWACSQARVIAAWGNHGTLDSRSQFVTEKLKDIGIELWHLGTTTSGHPLHPLARGKSFIPDDRELTRYLP